MYPFIETAYAMAPGGLGGDASSMFGSFLPIILIFLIFWLLVFRPQSKRAKAHRQLVADLKKGDDIFTDGGIRGTIQKVTDDIVTLEIAPKVAIRIQRSRITEMVKEGKALPGAGKGKSKAGDKDSGDTDSADA